MSLTGSSRRPRDRPKSSSDTHKTAAQKLPETDITNTVGVNSLSQAKRTQPARPSNMAGTAYSTTRECWCLQLMTEVKRLKRMMTAETKKNKRDSDRARRDRSLRLAFRH